MVANNEELVGFYFISSDQLLMIFAIIIFFIIRIIGRGIKENLFVGS